MARVYLKRTLTGFIPADEASLDLVRKYKNGAVYRADIVKPRSYQHHKLALALLNLTWDNLPERYTQIWPTFLKFRKGIAEAAGWVEEYTTLEGEVKTAPRSISYDEIPDDVEFGKVMGAMMTVCGRILDMTQPELAGEVSKYADEKYGAAA